MTNKQIRNRACAKKPAQAYFFPYARRQRARKKDHDTKATATSMDVAVDAVIEQLQEVARRMKLKFFGFVLACLICQITSTVYAGEIPATHTHAEPFRTENTGVSTETETSVAEPLDFKENY